LYFNYSEIVKSGAMPRILFVDDKEAHREAFRTYVERSGKGHEVRLCPDYAAGSAGILYAGFSHLITDLFMPQYEGLANRDLGRQLIERMAREDPAEARAMLFLEQLRPYVGENPEANLYLARFAREQRNDPVESPVAKAIIKVAKTFGTENPEKSKASQTATALIVKNTLSHVYFNDRGDYFPKMRAALEADVSKQPLGILLAEQAQERGLPLVIVTDTNHHGPITQKPYEYIGKKGWTFVDDARKEDPDFWEIPLRRIGL